MSDGGVASESNTFARYGDPGATWRLDREGQPQITPGLVELTFKKGRWDNSWFFRNWNEFVGGGTTVEQKEVLAYQFTFLVNVLLRDEPIEKRVLLIKHMVEAVRKYTRLERRDGQASYDSDPVLKSLGLPQLVSAINIEPGRPHPGLVMHEGVHLLQTEGYLPQLDALTFAVGKVAQMQFGEIGFVKTEDGEGSFLLEYLDRDKYLPLVLAGQTAKAFANWVRYYDPDDFFWKYRDNEEAIMSVLKQTNEREAPDMFGIKGKNVYTALMNWGHHRGDRAFAIGLVTGNMDHAWTVLWRYAKSGNFEEAEKDIVARIMEGTIDRSIDDYYDYPEVKLKVKAAGEV